jgi:hypothetical protein
MHCLRGLYSASGIGLRVRRADELAGQSSADPTSANLVGCALDALSFLNVATPQHMATSTPRGRQPWSGTWPARVRLPAGSPGSCR